MHSPTATTLGNLIACLEHGASPDDAGIIKGAGEVFGDMHTPFFCALGYACMEGAGEGTSKEAHLLKKAALESPENPLVVRLGRIAQDVVKSAGITNVGRNITLPLVTRSVAFTPDILKVLLGGSALAGGALGSLAFMANRSVNRDDEKNEELKARVAYYRQISDELKARMASSEVAS